MQSKKRQSNFELLRIISMIMIIAHHFVVHGKFEFESGVLSINRIWTQFIQMGGKIGVDVFVLISGYFLIYADKIKIKKAIKLWLQIFFYSIILFATFTLTGINDFSIKMCIKSFLPVCYSLWWFASTYFVLYLISPYINKLLKNLNAHEYKNMLLLFTTIWCIIPTFFAGTSVQSSNLVWFIYLYCISGYLKLYENEIKNYKSSLYLMIAITLIFLTLMSAVIFDIIGLKYEFFAKHATYFYDMGKLPILLISILLFIGFKNLNIPYSNFINILASATFGVYLIHDHPYTRPFLWETIFKNAQYKESDYLILYSVMCIILVYIICTLIELLRIHVIERLYIKFLS